MKRIFSGGRVGLGALILIVLLGLAQAGTAAAQGPLADSFMPVIVRGADVPILQGAPTASLWVYAYWSGALWQIPYQIDHVVAGAYSADPATTLGPADEIVFMAADMGTLATPAQIVATLPISSSWYQIEVTDSLSPTQKAYVYVVQSSLLTPTTTAGYVSFDAQAKRIQASAYTLGLLAGHPGFDYLALNGSGVDILDRTKIRIPAMGGLLTQTEDNLPEPAVDVRANGPVRAIIQGGGTIAYRSMVQTVLAQSLLGVDSVRLSTDFSQVATGSTFYNASVGQGVTVDGNPDAVSPAPSPWWQLSGGTGTLVQVMDASQVGGTQSTYYKDDANVDLSDTGDQKSYGDVGVMVNSPNVNAVYRQALVVLPPNMPNVGLIVAAGADPTRLGITATLQTAPPPYQYRIYLPILMR